MTCRGALPVIALVAACATVSPRFPPDVQTAITHDEMRRLETERFIIYYPAARRALVDRFLARADRCATVLHEHASMKGLEKIIILMPEAAFNNAFVAPGAVGYEQVSVIPTFSTLDFATAFGLPPDPGSIACHELVHYVHFQQTKGFWGFFNKVFGPTYTSQLGYDPWFDEGIATHYEARLVPGMGRPVWPIFTGMFAAAYSGRHISSGELSIYARNASVGHHYLVGSMFVRFLVEKFGERPLWRAIDNQAGSFTGWLFPTTFKAGFATSFGDLMDQFNDWAKATFPARARPPTQRVLDKLGNDARYARGRDGTEAWVTEDVDVPTKLIIRDPTGAILFEKNLVEVLPLRKLVIADPLLFSGLSVTADGREVWFTVIDLGATFQVTRLMRWRRDEGLSEVTTDLGPGATIDPSGGTYYYCAVDGDRWSLAAWDTRTEQKRLLVDMKPGTFVLGAQASPDGKQLAANVWDGNAFVVWIIDAASGAIAQKIAGGGTPVYDASFTSDGRPMWLGVVDKRFQVFIDGQQVTDAPYAVLAARETNGTIRFLDRERWNWELAEVATPPKAPPPAAAPAEAPPAEAPPAEAPTAQIAPPPAATASAQSAPTTAAPPAPAPTTSGPPAATPSAPTAGPPGTAPVTPPPLYPSQPLPPPPAVAVQSDNPYSIFDHLFYPEVRSPTIATGGSGFPAFGLLLAGGDRLFLQRWMLAGYAQPTIDNIGTRTHWGAGAGYLNNMLAPAIILAQGGFLDWAAPVATDDPMVTLTEEHRTRDASLAIGYIWRGTLTATAGFVYTDDYVQTDVEPATRAYLTGPQVTLDWIAGESTRYTGLRRALILRGQAAYYPVQWSSFLSNITDVGGSIGTVLPLPFGRRHTISAVVRGRALISPMDTGLLQVGGNSELAFLWNRHSTTTDPPEFDLTRFPTNLRFLEPLRGYEDYAITTDRVGIGEIAWRYPIIIDRGTAALWFLPAHYLRELDIELFAAGAIDQEQRKHYAVGGALTLKVQLLRIPFNIVYQLARRLVDDKAITQFIALGFEL